MYDIVKQKFMKIYIKKNLSIIITAILLTSCSYLEGLFKYAVPLEKMSIVADKDANYSSATSVDLVVINDIGLLAMLGTMTAKTYFEKKDQLVRSNPSKIRVWHFEIVPGKKKENIPITFEEFQPEGAYVFANYNNNSDNRVLLKSVKEITVIMKRAYFQIHSSEEE